MFIRQKQEIYDLVKNLTKWIITRELRDDGRYIERLLEKLILEMDSRSNLTLHVNQKDFSHMPEVLESVQDKIGQLSNVRIVVDQDIKDYGMKLDSENGIISGTIEEQFKSLDRLFHSVELWED
jgi:flagellar assembly protein FliH